MPPCHQNCTIRNLLKIAMKELDNLNHVREDLDDLSFNEPGRLAEFTAKLKAVAGIEDRKMAEARTLITYTCYIRRFNKNFITTLRLDRWTIVLKREES